MKHQGRGVIRLDDKTDHGGQVICATSETITMSKAVAIQDDMTFCLKCKGKFAIKQDGAGAKHKGKPYTYDGDITECGAPPDQLPRSAALCPLSGAKPLTLQQPMRV